MFLVGFLTSRWFNNCRGVFVLQISSIRSRCKHPQAWRRGGTLLIWVRAPRRPLAHVSVPFNVSAVIDKYTLTRVHRYTCMTLGCQRMCDPLPSCMHTKPVLQYYFFWFPNTLLSCAPSHPLVFFVFPCFPVGPLSLYPHPPLPALLLSLSLTHTLFPFQQPVPVQILSDFLSAAQHFSAAFFPLQPCSDPPRLQFSDRISGGSR